MCFPWFIGYVCVSFELFTRPCSMQTLIKATETELGLPVVLADHKQQSLHLAAKHALFKLQLINC
jgi:hypothetical protein